MKTISGRVIYTKPIHLSNAAKALSNFVAAETGASQAVSAYVKRTSASFTDLAQFHKDIDGEVGRKFEDCDGSDSARKRHNKKREKRENLERESGGGCLVIREVDDGVDFDLAEQSSSRKKKRIRIEHD